MEAVRVKICGLSEPGDVEFAVAAGADYVGFVFFPNSPRHVSPGRIRDLACAAGQATTVALMVNPPDREIDDILQDTSLGMIQLHGNEPPERVRSIGEAYGVPVMKAVGLEDESDLGAIDDYSLVADQLLIDTKAVPGASRPGGSGISFDWTLIKDREWKLPWLLAGGLDAGNVAAAIRATRARQVDVSTGVESSPGRKDRSKIAEFIKAAKGH